MNPFFSIIIVNYNYGEFLEQCLKSVIDQNEKDYELIFIDGGSTDLSVEILNRYQSYFKYYVSERDNGQSHAINKGLNQATGDYVFWLNSDDFLIYDSLSLAKAFIKKNLKFKWFTCNTIFVSEENIILKFHKGLDLNNYILCSDYINVGGPTSIVKKTVYDDVGLFNENLNYTMDSDMWIRISKANYLRINMNIYMWGFRLHSKSKTASSHFKIFNDKHLKEILSIKYLYNINDSILINIFEYTRKLVSINYLVAYLHNFIYGQMNLRDFEVKFFKTNFDKLFTDVNVLK